MNYIELVNLFWEKDLEHNFTDKDVSLYFYLLSVCNRLTWKNPFGQSNAMIVAKFGWGKRAFDSAKKKLKDAGLIDFRAGDGRGNTYQYHIVGIEKAHEKGTRKHTLSAHLSDTLSDTLSAHLSAPKCEASININKTKSNKPPIPPKIKFAEFVSMTNAEYEALVAKIGNTEDAGRCIEILDNYKGSSGKKYKSDYRAILNWVIDRINEQKNAKQYKNENNSRIFIGNQDYGASTV